MTYFGRVPFSHNEFHKGQTGNEASYPVYHPGSVGEIPLGFDRIVDEVSNEFFFYGSSHSHHHEEIFSPSDVFGLNVPGQHFYGQPLVAYGEPYPENPVSRGQQGTVSPMVGFRSYLLSDYRNFSPVDPYPYSQERELCGGSSVNSVTNVFGSAVERGNTSPGFPIGFNSVDAQRPISLDNRPFGQEERDESGIGEACLTNTSRRCSIGPAWPHGSGHHREDAGWSIQLVEANQGSNENTAGFCNTVEKIRHAYPASDLKTNTGRIWSVTTRFPDHILGGIKFRISVWTDFSPSPVLLTQQAGCITHDFIVEILRCTNQYPAQEECFLSVYGSDEFLQKLSSHFKVIAKKIEIMSCCIESELSVFQYSVQYVLKSFVFTVGKNASIVDCLNSCTCKISTRLISSETSDHTLGSHESLRKATPCVQLRLHNTTHLRQSLARTVSIYYYRSSKLEPNDMFRSLL
ncbi:hypothetical protein BTVI_104517 [Pitangus sulphuratus]|nr:hypothetical protein BTVI_104517 [Pitangus sulphuratus]